MSRPSQPNQAFDPKTTILDRRNPGGPLDLDWLRFLRVSRADIERSAAATAAGSAPRADQQAALLLRAVTCFDLTPVTGEDPRYPLRSVCASARQPISASTLAAFGAQHLPLQVGALCVPCDHVADAARALRLSGIPVAGHSPGGPSRELKIEEVVSCAADGAEEFDAEVTSLHIRKSDWPALYDEVAAIRSACPSLTLKVTLTPSAGCPLGRLSRAALVCAMAGADFVAAPWRNLAAESVASALYAYYRRTGVRIGLKLGEVTRTARQTLEALALVKHVLGAEWIRPALFRMEVDASLAGVGRQLEHYAHGPAARTSPRAA